MEDLVEKHPSARQTYDADLSQKLGDSDTALVLESVTATSSAGSDVTAVVVGAVSKSGLVLTAVLKDGTHGEDYKLLFKAVGNVSAQLATLTVEMRVRDNILGNL